MGFFLKSIKAVYIAVVSLPGVVILVGATYAAITGLYAAIASVNPITAALAIVIAIFVLFAVFSSSFRYFLIGVVKVVAICGGILLMSKMLGMPIWAAAIICMVAYLILKLNKLQTSMVTE